MLIGCVFVVIAVIGCDGVCSMNATSDGDVWG